MEKNAIDKMLVSLSFEITERADQIIPELWVFDTYVDLLCGESLTSLVDVDSVTVIV